MEIEFKMLKDVIEYHAGPATFVEHEGREYWKFSNAGVETIAAWDVHNQLYHVWRNGDEVVQSCGGDLVQFAEIFSGFEFESIGGVLRYITEGVTP
jgi:hypothetical protein